MTKVSSAKRIGEPSRQTNYNSDFSMETTSMSNEMEPPRKKRLRARLDHLSPSEKLQRRKLKNRIAAQTARDRKRAKIDQLEDENRKLREENLRLKSQLGVVMSDNIPSIEIVDSGVSELDGNSRPPSSSMNSTPISSNYLKANGNRFPQSPDSSVSGVYSCSEYNDFIDSVVDHPNETELIDEVLKLQDSLFSTSADVPSIESAELISEPQQRVQEGLCRLPSVENSAGWTSIQLMLLLMISRVHHLYSSRTNCCVTPICDGQQQSNRTFGNIYDYILQSRCIDFKRAAEAIICNKNNIRQQRLAALEFVYRYLYSNRLYQTYQLKS